MNFLRSGRGGGTVFNNNRDRDIAGVSAGGSRNEDCKRIIICERTEFGGAAEDIGC